MRGLVTALLFWIGLLLASRDCEAHQLVLATGYANSRTPDSGPDIHRGNPPFRAGGGYAFTVRVDLDSHRRDFWFGPALTFWNNLTGDPDPNANASYFQIELGGRLLLRTRTVPSLYGGVGGGYTLSHGEVIAKVGDSKESYDGEFPTGSVHFGVKSPNPSGIAILAEGSYHFGLGEARGGRAVGPAAAWLIQIGVGMDILLGPQK